MQFLGGGRALVQHGGGGGSSSVGPSLGSPLRVCVQCCLCLAMSR